jgi:hypothetical protein
MRVKTKFLSKWKYDNKWLEAFKNEIIKQLPKRKVWLIIENIPNEDYVIQISGKTGKVIIHFNMDPEMEIRAIFEKGYLEAVVEHEIKHLQPNINYTHDFIPAPESIIDERGIITYNEIGQILTGEFRDFLVDVYANSAMSIDRLKKYLAYEIEKLKIALAKMGETKTIRTIWLLVASYIETCYEAVGEPIPDDLASLSRKLQEDESNIAIYNQMKVAYAKMWKSVKAGSKHVDLTQETYKLNELIKRQLRPWC